MYEYKVIPAPVRTVKVKGLKTTVERFAHMLDSAINADAQDGWEFLRAETLPCEERKGLTGTSKSFQSVLVFRRALTPRDAGRVDILDTVSEPSHTNGEMAEPVLSAADTAAPRLSLVATRHEPEASAPPPSGRQEPVLRPGAARAPAPSDRPEPVLRTRAMDEGER